MGTSAFYLLSGIGASFYVLCDQLLYERQLRQAISEFTQPFPITMHIKSHRKLQIGSLKIANRGKVVFLSSLFCPFRSPKIANRSLKIANWILGRALTDIIPA